VIRTLRTIDDGLVRCACSHHVEVGDRVSATHPPASAARHAISRRPTTPDDDRTRVGEPAQAWFFHPLRARSGCFVSRIAKPLDIVRAQPQDDRMSH
jgi:hypothetical protein